MAVLTAVALIVFIIEAQIPLPIPAPGVKLGLANTVTLFALFYGSSSSRGRNTGGRVSCVSREVQEKRLPVLTTAEVFMILVCRIILGAVFTGRVLAFIYSIAGGVLAFAAQAVMRKLVTDRQVWACGAVGAVFHNIGQIGAAMVITETAAIAAYLPVLIIAGVVTGAITGLAAQTLVACLK